jgi:hypothetical protein
MGRWLSALRHWCFESFRVFPATLAEGGSGKGKTLPSETCPDDLLWSCFGAQETSKPTAIKSKHDFSMAVFLM